MAERPPKRVGALFGGGRGNDPEDVGLRRVLQDPGRISLHVAHDDAARRVRRRRSDAGQAERDRVGQRHVLVVAGDEDGRVRRHAVHQRAGRERRAGPTLLVPVAPEDPLALRGALRALANPADEFFRCRGVLQVDAVKLCASGHQVDVRVVEAGHDEPAARVDDPRGRCAPLLDFRTCADGSDPVAHHRHRLGFGPGRIHRPHAGVHDDDVRRLAGGRLASRGAATESAAPRGARRSREHSNRCRHVPHLSNECRAAHRLGL